MSLELWGVGSGSYHYLGHSDAQIGEDLLEFDGRSPANPPNVVREQDPFLGRKPAEREAGGFLTVGAVEADG